MLKLFLFGPPRVELAGKPLVVKPRKALALLLYLACEGRDQARDSLATLFWPEAGQRQARAALRRRLSELNQALGNDWVEADREQVGLRLEAELWLDVAQFQQHLAACQQHGHPPDNPCPQCLEPLAAAVALYQADFLSGFTLPNCSDFDDWQFFQTEGLRQALASALERLINLHLAQGHPEAALPYGRRRLALDPLHEPAHRQLMVLYAQAGQQAAALRQYQLCLETLEVELDLSPSPETTALYHRIRQGDLVSSVSLPGLSEESASPRQSSRPPVPLVEGRSAPDVTAFYGQEVAHLSLSLLGTFQAHLGRQPLTGFQSNKIRALLAYLAVEAHQPHELAHLADLFWPDWTEEAAHAYLRHALANLRALFDDHQAARPFLITTHQTIQFNLDSDYWLDVTELERSLPRNIALASLRDSVDLDRLQQVIALYQGSFMEGFFLDGCAAYEEWQRLTRERLQRRVSEGLHLLVEGYEREGNYEQALRHAWQQVELNPWQDEAHHQLMRLLALTGAPGAALAHYEKYCQRLSEEGLKTPPAAEISALYEQIKSGQFEIERAARMNGPPISPLIVSPLTPLPPSFLAISPSPPPSDPPFVARQQELSQLKSHLEATCSGQGRVVFITGEAGSGKTALLQAFSQLAQEYERELIVAEGKCNAYAGVGDPYLPFREIFDLLTGNVEEKWLAGVMNRAQVSRLWHIFPLTIQRLMIEGPNLIGAFIHGPRLLDQISRYLSRDVPWVAQLSDLVARQVEAGTNPAASSQQLDLFKQVTAVLQAIAREQPLLLLLDDLQWADQGSLSLLFHLGRHLAGSPILLVGAYRSDEVSLGRQGEPHPLEKVVNEFQRDFGDIRLDLDQADGRGFVEALLDTEPHHLSWTFQKLFYHHSQGQPLFTLELWREMQRRGDLIRDEHGYWVSGADLDWQTLPARVEAAIAERINRLPDELREVLTLASVEGEQFTAEIVAQLHHIAEPEMVRLLSRELDRKHHLVIAQGFQRIGSRRLSRYRFRHILFQKYLYTSLDDVERVYLHEAVGVALENLYSEQQEGSLTLTAQLAWHFQQAGLYEKAITYLWQAGVGAAQVFADHEVITHLETGLALLKTLPQTPARLEQELQMQMKLIPALGNLYGYTAPQLQQVQARALELVRQLGDEAQLFSIRWILWRSHHVWGDLTTAHNLAEQLVVQATAVQDQALIIEAHYAMGATLFARGQLVSARRYLEQSLKDEDPSLDQARTLTYGQSSRVVSHIFLAFSLWGLGYPDQALASIQTALALAHQLEHPFSLAFAFLGAAGLHQFRHEPEAAFTRADTALAISQQHQFKQWVAWTAFIRSWALVMKHQEVSEVEAMRRHMTDWQGIGYNLWQVRLRVQLAEACAQVGQINQGLLLLNEALPLMHETKECLLEAELHRLMGELLIKEGGDNQVSAGEAEAHFYQAIEIARQQQAKLWELRATISLSRLLHRQGKFAEGRQMLADIYNWFTEGFDTPDLLEAASLLQSF